MNIILLKKIKNLGDIGSEVKVKPGYARNFLLPQKHAVLPTKENLKIIEARKDQLLKQEELLKAEAIEKQNKLEGYTITFEVNVQEEDDKLFGSITLQNILDRIKEDGHEIEKKQVNLPSGPIKSLGDNFIITISLHSDITVTVPLKVVKAQ